MRIWVRLCEEPPGHARGSGQDRLPLPTGRARRSRGARGRGKSTKSGTAVASSSARMIESIETRTRHGQAATRDLLRFRICAFRNGRPGQFEPPNLPREAKRTKIYNDKVVGVVDFEGRNPTSKRSEIPVTERSAATLTSESGAAPLCTAPCRRNRSRSCVPLRRDGPGVVTHVTAHAPPSWLARCDRQGTRSCHQCRRFRLRRFGARRNLKSVWLRVRCQALDTSALGARWRRGFHLSRFLTACWPAPIMACRASPATGSSREQPKRCDSATWPTTSRRRCGAFSDPWPRH